MSERGVETPASKAAVEFMQALRELPKPVRWWEREQREGSSDAK